MSTRRMKRRISQAAASAVRCRPATDQLKADCLRQRQLRLPKCLAVASLLPPLGVTPPSVSWGLFRALPSPRPQGTLRRLLATPRLANRLSSSGAQAAKKRILWAALDPTRRNGAIRRAGPQVSACKPRASDVQNGRTNLRTERWAPAADGVP